MNTKKSRNIYISYIDTYKNTPCRVSAILDFTALQWWEGCYWKKKKKYFELMYVMSAYL